MTMLSGKIGVNIFSLCSICLSVSASLCRICLSTLLALPFPFFPRLQPTYGALIGVFLVFCVLNNTGILAQELVTHEGPVEQLLKGDINPFGTY